MSFEIARLAGRGQGVGRVLNSNRLARQRFTEKFFIADELERSTELGGTFA